MSIVIEQGKVVVLSRDSRLLAKTSSSETAAGCDTCRCVCSVGTFCSDLTLPIAFNLNAGTISDNGGYTETPIATNGCDLLSGDWFIVNGSRVLSSSWGCGYTGNSVTGSCVAPWNDAGTSPCAYYSAYDELITISKPGAITWSEACGPPESVVTQGTTEGPPEAPPGDEGRLFTLIKGVANDGTDNAIVTGYPAGQTIAFGVVWRRPCGTSDPNDGGFRHSPGIAWILSFGVPEGSPGSMTVPVFARATAPEIETTQNAGVLGTDQVVEDITVRRGHTAVLYQADVPIGDDLDFTQVSSFTLDLETPTSITACTGPAQITITPISSEEILTNGYLAGSDGCTPPVLCDPLISPTGVIELSFSLSSGGTGAVCLTGPVGESTGPFTGLVAAGFPRSDITAPCDDYTILFTLECEDGEYQLRVEDASDSETGTGTFQEEPNIIPIPNGADINDGTIVVGPASIDICGETNISFSGLLSHFESVGPQHPLGCVCPGGTGGGACFLLESIPVSATLEFGCDQVEPPTCLDCVPDPTVLELSTGPLDCGLGTGNEVTPTDFDPENQYFIGTISFGPDSSTSPNFMVLYCGDGVMRYAFLEENLGNCLITEQGTVTWDCEASAGSFQFFGTDECANSYTLRFSINGG